MSTSDDCNDGASKSNDDVCEVNDMLQNMTNLEKTIISVCANCGKEGNDINNTCNKCKMVKYCNAACKKKHKKKHKKACDRRVAELHDEKLFKPPPLQYGDCQYALNEYHYVYRVVNIMLAVERGFVLDVLLQMQK